MSTRVFLNIISLTVLATACHTHKKVNASTAIANEPAIQLDTISVVANEPFKKPIYQESNPRSNDIIHTKLEVNFDWTACKMNGKASLMIKPYFYPTNMLYLNARGMDIKKVEVLEIASVKEKKKLGAVTTIQSVDIWNTVAASSYVYENDSLKINLGRIFLPTENYHVMIDYVAKPNELKSGGSSAITEDKGLYFINPTGENPYKLPQIWTQGETQASSVWFPTIDSPNEKMTQEIFMTVEDKYLTLSNGSLVESTKTADGKRIDHWKLDSPHSPYLAMMAVGEFKKVVDEPWNGKEISYYVEKDYEAHAKAIFGDTKEMIEFYSNKLGVPYAWPKYSQIVARDYVSGAMENTSATLHGDFMVYQTTREMIDGKKGNSVIAHELFHQWFGDIVTAESWSNLPLNESFATYGEYLWEEYKNGRDAADYHGWQSKQGYLYSQKEVDLIRFNYKDKEDMFDAFSYNKGGQVLHMLRKAVGDEAFFASLKNYLETNKFKSAEIHHLRLAFEETTGKDMNWFFNQWFLNSGRPKIKVTKNFDSLATVLSITVEQTQDLKKVPLYTLPLEVDVYEKGKIKRHHLLITQQKQTFPLYVNFAPQLVNFDAERQLLCDLDYAKNPAEYIFQYKNAPLYEDRYEALSKLEDKLSDEAVYNLFKDAAKNDKFYAIRNYALSRLEKVSENKSADIKALLSEIYQNDTKTTTRAKALEIFNKKFMNDADFYPLNDRALNEASYAIVGEALSALTKANPQKAMEKAKNFETESGKDVLFPIANLYALHGGDGQLAFFHNAIKYFNGFELMSFCNFYAKATKRFNNNANTLIASHDLEIIGKTGNKYLKYSAIKGIKDILSVWETKENTEKTNLANAKKDNKDTLSIETNLKSISQTKDILAKMLDGLK